MKMKIGELKTHLSKMVKEVNTSQEPLEVCVREETVAYLVPATSNKAKKIDPELEEKINKSGLRITQVGQDPGPLNKPSSSPNAGIGNKNSVVAMRQEKDY